MKKFVISITINESLERIVDVFSNKKFYKLYQKGFLGKEVLSGEEGEVGSKSLIRFQQGKNLIELEETILENNLPHSFYANYHHKHMDNTMRTSFTTIDTRKVKMDIEVEYTAFRGILPKLISTLFPGLFRKQIKGWTDNFIAYLEYGVSTKN